jgi:hypothetical protein
VVNSNAFSAHIVRQTRLCGNHFWTAEKLSGSELPEPETNENSAENKIEKII